MQTQDLESLSPSEIGGEHGASSQVGRLLMGSETLAGQRQLHLNVWLDALLTDRNWSNTSWYMGITEVSLKVGGMGEARTEQSMRFFK